MEHTVFLGTDVERIVEVIARERDRDIPDSLGTLGHIPDVLRDALALGVQQLCRQHRLAARTAADETWDALAAAVDAADFPRVAELADSFVADLLRDGPPVSWAPDRETHLAVALVVLELAQRAASSVPSP